ncbi:MAG: hypothetical protein J6Y35_05030 [Bacteroidales bacterium]|nr:hypothetical protein [Bacteroidales bacterium]
MTLNSWRFRCLLSSATEWRAYGIFPRTPTACDDDISCISVLPVPAPLTGCIGTVMMFPVGGSPPEKLASVAAILLDFFYTLETFGIRSKIIMRFRMKNQPNLTGSCVFELHGNISIDPKAIGHNRTQTVCQYRNRMAVAVVLPVFIPIIPFKKDSYSFFTALHHFHRFCQIKIGSFHTCFAM